ncbi:DUF4190 domain-containing protein [Herbiconiux sp.]|uniref:DUF4190 domain-containing protein n=1 Tax=Herbiconiux sp. TaxID=1871186 RepID=UPI0025C1EBBA|nr:DUF4190 domain-containing protein [Herbiconiux sp.]
MTQPTPGYAAVPAAPKTNVLAIVSLVIAILQFNLIAIILGAIALNQIKKTGENGRGLAIAGIVIGALSILFWVIIIIVIAVAAASNPNVVTTY